jgi:hypothetical protein
MTLNSHVTKGTAFSRRQTYFIHRASVLNIRQVQGTDGRVVTDRRITYHCFFVGAESMPLDYDDS